MSSVGRPVAVALDQVHHGTSQAGELGPQPLGRATAVLGVRGQGAHARDGEEVNQLLEQPGLLAIGKSGIHGPGLGNEWRTFRQQ
jgi:hypothetical protein